MVWIAVAIAVIIILIGIIIFALYYNGLFRKYRPINRAKENQIKVACVGDSITYGCMIKNWSKNNYPTVLGGILGEEYCVNNYGYTNRTALKSGDYPYMNEKIYKQSLEFNPDIVVLLLGTNDSKANNWDRDKFIHDYSQIIDSYAALASSPKIYALIPPPVFKSGGKVLYKIRKDVIENEICPLIESIANTNGIELVDMREVFKEDKKLFADGVHPNTQGSRLFAQKIGEVIKNN